MSENAYLAAFSHAEMTPRAVLALVRFFESAEAAWKASEKDIRNSGALTPESLAKFLALRGRFSLEKMLKEIERSGAGMIGCHEANYPEALKTIYDPPPILFYKGSLDCLSLPCLAVVGTRAPSRGGEMTARKIAESLSACGYAIVSGMALGIDAAAHRGAIESGGKTAAVLGSGLSRVYPAAHETLSREIAQNGIVVSEFPPHVPARSWNFPRRNRVISGLSLGVIVVEARGRSGALITAGFAAEQGRQVFAVPGDPWDERARGANALIQDGAKLVQEIGDILGELSYNSTLMALPLSPLRNPGKRANAHQEKILAILKNERNGRDIDSLTIQTGFPVEQVSGMLVLLEAEGRIRRFPGNIYMVA